MREREEILKRYQYVRDKREIMEGGNFINFTLRNFRNSD